MLSLQRGLRALWAIECPAIRRDLGFSDSGLAPKGKQGEGNLVERAGRGSSCSPLLYLQDHNQHYPIMSCSGEHRGGLRWGGLMSCGAVQCSAVQRSTVHYVVDSGLLSLPPRCPGSLWSPTRLQGLSVELPLTCLAVGRLWSANGP